MFNNGTDARTAIKRKRASEFDRINSIVSNPQNQDKGHVQGPLDVKFGQHRVFPVTINLSNVDLGKTPETVEEYLAQVRLESEWGNSNKYNENEEYSSDESEVFYIGNSNKEKDDKLEEGRLLIPHSVVDSALAEFSHAQAEYVAYRSTLEELDAIALPENQKQWKQFFRDVSCEREYIAQIVEEREHWKLLSLLTKWLGINVEQNIVTWILSLLAALEKEMMTPTELAIVRSLGKKASHQLRALGVGTTAEQLQLHEKIVAVVAVHFAQRDLLEK
ncbi:hypothetical protein DAMA08_030340 [Martiniozyma asiatica (nom. inval.)]|nr:hypothetical protein DAMA08_030340 [Martiniozyma asiatica]